MSSAAAAPGAGTTRVVLALGTTQTLAWASSYYIPAILAAPMAREFGIAASSVFGAFSAALVFSALLGPVVGRAIDARGGRDMLALSNLVMAAGLCLLAVAPGPVVMVVGWLVIGAGMAMGTYDAAFATLAGLYGRAARGPITGITLLAGFASTIGWPFSALVEAEFGWRSACLAWAALHVVVGLPLNRLLVPRSPPPVASGDGASATDGAPPPLVLFGFGWLALMLAVAILADLLAPYAYTALDLRNRLSPPILLGGTWLHPLGTDELGRDVLSRLIYSIRTSLLIAFGATIIGAVVGTTLGFLAAHFRGVVEQAVLALVDFSASLPFLILALAVLAFFGNSLVLLVCLLGLHAWERYARIARGLALAAGAQGYAAAVRGLGASPWRIYGQHVLPNIASTLIVSMTLAFPEVILLESGLSFLGLGVQPPQTSLGSMVGYGREYLTRAPWILLAPAATIVLTTLSVSLIGDWLRDRLDPTLR